ncbi:MAG: glycosyltransferase family 2 protein [Chloroflexi bacterium]|nr:glycosyltransferase family 2 protein [Chloroflexota bacterium]
MKTCVIIPAYNAGKVVTSVIERIPAGLIDEIIVVDDASRDNTFEVLSAISVMTVLRHTENRGYGGAQITLHDAALQRGADVVVLMHSDGGHFPEELPQMLEPILSGQAQVVLGARIHGVIENSKPFLGSSLLGALFNGQIPPTRLMGHLFLTGIQNLVFGTHYDAWHSGYRAMTREAIHKVPYHDFGTGYLFDTEFLLAAHSAGLKIKEVPVSSFYDPRSGSTVEPFSYGLKVLRYVLTQRIKLFAKRNVK